MRAMNGTGKSGRAMALAVGVCACMLTLGLSGCVFTTPSRAEGEPEPIEAVLTSDDLVNDGVLTVAMDITDAPQAMTDADGVPSGYYVDVARALAERLGLDLKVVSSANASNAIEDGEADIYLGTKIADDDEGLAVTEAIVGDASSVFAHNEDGSREAPALDADSLAGSVIAVQSDSASQDALDRGGVDATLKACSNVNECFEALSSGAADYVVCDATAGAYLARAYPGTVFVATVGSLSTYGIAMPDVDSDLTCAVEDAMDGLQGDGTLEAIYRSWYGSLPFDLAGSRLSGLTATSDDETAGQDGEDQGETGSSSSQGDSDLTFSGDINAID